MLEYEQKMDYTYIKNNKQNLVYDCKNKSHCPHKKHKAFIQKMVTTINTSIVPTF